ncbi:unnamed protein product [Orchesella dallaii]|uniref:F-box domain-containing protein n=1 Tax=Orchesella dallaii TaxID=48710 RepID=A0ABP1Q7F0_9HEXA
MARRRRRNRRVIEVPEGEVNNGNGAGPTSANDTQVESALTLSGLPEELLLMILGYLEHPRDLNACQGVNHYWKSLAIQVGIKKTIALWKRWDPSETAFHRSLARLPSPTLKLESFDKTDYPAGLKTSWGKTSPTLSTHSLSLKPLGRTCCQPEILFLSRRTEPERLSMRNSLVLSSFFETYGHHLTYLHLFDLKLHPQQLYSALQKMPNLEALTLTTVGVGTHILDRRYTNVTYNYSSPCSKLTHLRMGNRTDHWTLQDKVFKWFESQLTSLEYDGSDYTLNSNSWVFQGRSNNEGEPNINYVPFKKVERLKIYSDWEYFSHDNIVPFVAVKHFSLLLMQPLDYQKLTRLLKYLDKMAGTLVHLHLHVEVQYQLNTRVPLDRKIVVFSNLTKFAITDDGVSGLVPYFLKRFKKLEKLQLLNNFELRYNHDNLEEGELIQKIVSRFEDENYWALCGTRARLNSIQFKKNQFTFNSRVELVIFLSIQFLSS